MFSILSSIINKLVELFINEEQGRIIAVDMF